ncbi:Hypothetical protein RAK1035_1606 [Roseovarius sp. AK1035]|nr:Hypothetical protein RAK1035_1606 [Roseovarius sp. AK1035]
MFGVVLRVAHSLPPGNWLDGAYSSARLASTGFVTKSK